MAVKVKDEEGKDINPEKTVQISEDALQNFMNEIKNMRQELDVFKTQKPRSADAKVIAEAMIESQRIQNNDYDPRPIREEDIDKDDYLSIEDAVSFFCPKSGYAIADDRRYNQDVRTPYGQVIWFESAGEEIVNAGKNLVYNVISQYVSRSKKEVEWLRNHTYFNIFFFETSKEALDMSHEVYDVLFKKMKALDGLEPYDIIQKMKSVGMDPSKDVQQNKKKLAIFYSKQDIDALARGAKKMSLYEGEGRALNDMELLNLKPQAKG